MFNDQVFRQFRERPFDEQYQRNGQFKQFTDTLIISEIVKCGKQILGSLGIQVDDPNLQQQAQTTQHAYSRSPSRNNISHKHSGYIYEHDYNRHLSSMQHNSSTQEISFTLSNEDNPRQRNSEARPRNFDRELEEGIVLDLEDRYDGKGRKKSFEREKVGKWKKEEKVKERQFYPVKSRYFVNNYNESLMSTIAREESIQQSNNNHKKSNKSPPKHQNPTKNLSTSKTFTLSYQTNPNFNQPMTTTPPKHRKSIFSKQKSYTNTKNTTYNPTTPSPLPKTQARIPLSQKITKTIYGKLKEEVKAKDLAGQMENEERLKKQHAEDTWGQFIKRNDHWIEERKRHAIEREFDDRNQNVKANYRNMSPSRYVSGDANNLLDKQHITEYLSVKIPTHNRTLNNSPYKVKTPIHPPHTTFTKNVSPQKPPSSVQNCLNRLKTQTQLLKVKLLSPFRQQFQEDEKERIVHYRKINDDEARKEYGRVRSKDKFEGNKEKWVIKNHSNSSVQRKNSLERIKQVYGDCMGYKNLDSKVQANKSHGINPKNQNVKRGK